MQKQQRSGSRKKELRNQNHSLGASVSSLIGDLMSLIEGNDFKTAYLKETYLSKYADPSPSTQLLRRDAAIAKWKAVEQHNAETNERLSSAESDFNILPRITLGRFLKHCRWTVKSVLGELTNDVVVGGFSGGASTSRRHAESHPGFKFSDKADVTEDACFAVDILHREVPFFRTHGMFYHLKEVAGAVLFTVPKNSDIDRCACKEPDINMYLQRGVGKHIRRRLLRSGINLNDQSINRGLAREGSITGALATLDLSSASDCVSIGLVRTLLPEDWYLYLNDIRSSRVSVDGDIVTTGMFSSMGNGFTFELESLLFFAIAKSVLYFEGVPGRLSVYGDDIICPVRGYDMITWVLSWFGFIPNLDKSFASGPFRESCGGHYHMGEDVTPFFLKRPADNLTDLIRVTNQLRKWALSSDADLQIAVCDPSIYLVWEALRDLIPKDLWGGSDLSVDTQLVTLDSPNKRLVRMSQAKRVPSVGLYAHWQNSNWSRKREPEGPARDVTDHLLMCRRRRAPNWGDVTSRGCFYEEAIA